MDCICQKQQNVVLASFEERAGFLGGIVTRMEMDTQKGYLELSLGHNTDGRYLKKEDMENTARVRVEYCPFCGRKLK
jgi:hypothetical protein